MANAWGGAPQNNTMVTFINDDSMALNYPVAPGYTVALINANDPEDSKMYLKSAQANGMPNPMRIFKLTDITPQKQGSDTVSRKEFETLQQQLQQLIEGLAKGGKAK